MKGLSTPHRQADGCAKIKTPMKPPPKLRHTALGVALLLAAISSSALTLGRPRGAVIIGQPLDVSIPVRVESDDDAVAQCYEADVFQGDTRISGGRTTVTVVPGSSPQDMTVRVRSSAVVDEPVVSIYLRAGCVQRSTRRYVLLADVASEVVTPLTLPSVSRPAPLQPGSPGAAPSAAAPAGSRMSPAARAGSPAASANAATGVDTAPTQAAAERRRQRREEARAAQAVQAAPGAKPPAAAPKPAAVATGTQAATKMAPTPARDSIVRRKGDAAATRSRLKLDPLDLLVEVDPVLKGSAEILTPITENLQARAEAAALWRALNAQPLDILRDTQRLQTLEADVKSLRDVTAKNQASLSDLQVKLQKAEGERYANVLVYALGALLLAALALAGFLWWRGRSARAVQVWWNDRPRESGAESVSGASGHPPVAPAKAMTEVDVDLGMDENLFASLKSRAGNAPAPPVPPRYVAPPAAQNSDFGSSLPGMSRAVNAEELFDIQQQADFFMSLGQHDQAIEVLKNHISDNVETSALAYLDLLKIYHSLNRREDYDLLRVDFNRVFNAQVPVFGSYSDESNGLESYQTAMSRIEALWPSAKVLEIIEESIFRKPGTGDGEAFDLEAYRELLLLYAMAKDVVDRQSESAEFEYSSTPPELDDSRRTTRFSATSIQPLSAAHYSETGAADLLPEIPLPKPSPRLGLDIDLDEPGPDGVMMGGGEQKTDFDMNDFHSESIMEDIDSMGESRIEEPKAARDSHLIDFDLFDAATERQLAPRPVKPFKPSKG